MSKNVPIMCFLLLIYSCSTVNHPQKNSSENFNYDNDHETSSPSNFVTKESIKDYDLTVLKGGSYPEIKNNTPFTETELRILQNQESIELEATVEVAHYFKYFLRDKRDLLTLWIDNARPYIPFIKNNFIEKNLPEELIFLPFLESGYNVNAYSRVGAGGLWQFMPKTATSYGLKINWWADERRSPQLATPYAIKHLEYLNNLFGNWYSALAAYNAGEGRISRAMDKVNIYDYFELIKTNALPKETRKYVPQYLAIVKIMKNLELLGFDPINWTIPNNTITLTIPAGTDLYELSSNIGLKWSEFSKLNPSFRRKVSDPSDDSIVILPISKESNAISYLKNHKPIINDNGFTYYTVKSGDSWWYLSSLTNQSIVSLKRLNNISTNNLHIGQRLLLPGSNYKEEPIISNNYTSSGNLQTHYVRSGDTISSISIHYNIKLASLYSENRLNSRSILSVGQVIRLPGYPLTIKKVSNITKSTESYYTVRDGDSVWIIAQKTKIPYKQLLTLNNLNSNSRLKIGDKLLLY